MFNEPPQLPAEPAEQTTAPYLLPSQPAPLPAFCAHAQDYIWSARDQWNLLDSTTMWYKEIRHVKMLKEIDLVAGKALPVVPNKTFLDSVMAHQLRETSTGEIIILPDYPDVVRRIANIYSSPTFAEQGVLVTGQPGIGKSVLLSYLLLVLLNLTSEEHPQLRLRAAPVFLYTNTDKILFFGGHIYSPKAHVHFTPQMLPEPRSSELTEGPDGARGPWVMKKSYIWVLLDLDHDAKEPEGLVDAGHIFIVQSSSPNPSRYHYWVNWKNAIVIGLPLWSRELLIQGWKYQHARRKLDASLNHWVKKQRVARGLSTAEDEGIADMDLLDVRDLSLSGLSGFQKEMFLELPQQHRTTLEDAEVSDAELQSPDVLELIMEKLLNNAIEHFGYAARDIYTYLRNPAAVLSVHDDTYLPWKHAVTFLNTYLATGRALMMEDETTQRTGRLSHRICALKLNELANKANFWVSDSFTVVWKSSYIRSEMERKQQELTDEDRGKLFALLSVHSKATTFAGNIYEPYVHKVLRTPGSISSSPSDLPPMQPMTYRPRTCVKCGSKSSACPHTTDCVHETTTEQYSVYDDFFKGQRDYEYEKLPDWTQLDLDCYYRRVQPDNPLFDSFILRNGGSYIVAAFIQISIARGRGHTHTTTSAVTTITEVRENACRRFHKPVEIIYIYVAPDVLPTAKYPLRWTVDKVYLTQPVVSDAKVNEVQRVFYLDVPLLHNATQVANARHALSVRARSQNAMIYPDVKTLHEGNRGTKEPANKVRRTTEIDAPSSYTATSNAGGRVGRKVRDKRK